MSPLLKLVISHRDSCWFVYFCKRPYIHICILSVVFIVCRFSTFLWFFGLHTSKLNFLMDFEACTHYMWKWNYLLVSSFIFNYRFGLIPYNKFSLCYFENDDNLSKFYTVMGVKWNSGHWLYWLFWERQPLIPIMVSSLCYHIMVQQIGITGIHFIFTLDFRF